jgi:hypothetical protein
MAADTNIAADAAVQCEAQTPGRYPHLVYRNVLGGGVVAGLLDYMAAREKDFTPRVLRNRESGKLRVDRSLLDSMCLMDLGPFEDPIKTFVDGIAAQALTQLRLNVPAFESREFDLSAYRDGDHFGAHIDTDERLNRVRALSCVYYFAATPRRFSGGELRLHGFPTLSGGKQGRPAPFVDIVPETDTLIVFPSWLRHEVLPVRVPSGAWADSRFTINCWIHRTN